jgi:heptaprenylglyceryl phosphate synthase
VRILSAAAAALAALTAAACSSQAATTAPAAVQAVTPAASPVHAAAPTPKPAPKSSPSAVAPTASASACRTIVTLLNDTDTEARSQAAAKHVQFPKLTVQNLTEGYVSTDLQKQVGQITEDEFAPGATTALAGAEDELARAIPVVYDNYGDSSANGAVAQELAALKTINGICGGLG